MGCGARDREYRDDWISGKPAVPAAAAPAAPFTRKRERGHSLPSTAEVRLGTAANSRDCVLRVPSAGLTGPRSEC